MSRHLWHTGNHGPDDSSRDEQHLGIFAATLRAMKNLTGRPTSSVVPLPTPAQDPLGSVDLPRPRPTAEAPDVPDEELEETTVEFPRLAETEPTEPAMFMISRGRHRMW